MDSTTNNTGSFTTDPMIWIENKRKNELFKEEKNITYALLVSKIEELQQTIISNSNDESIINTQITKVEKLQELLENFDIYGSKHFGYIQKMIIEM